MSYTPNMHNPVAQMVTGPQREIKRITRDRLLTPKEGKKLQAVRRKIEEFKRRRPRCPSKCFRGGWLQCEFREGHAGAHKALSKFWTNRAEKKLKK